MGALPKNKITSVERGKRRRGNTPKITQDTKVIAVKSHKQGFVAEMMKFLGLAAAGTSKEAVSSQAKAEAKKAAKAAKNEARPEVARQQPQAKRKGIAPANRGRRQSQHKG